MTKKIWLVVLILLSSPVLARESYPASVKSGSPEVGSAIMSWKEAVEGSDVQAIVNLYDKDAIMISSFAQNPMTNRGVIASYYKKVISNPDVRVSIEEEHPRRFDNMAINTGRYTLSYTQEGEEVSVPARFSFVYQLQNNKWIIVDHHSSAVPLPKEVKN